MTREERYTQWRNMIEAQAASGMTVAIWCRENHVDISRFYLCRRRVRKQLSGFIELKADKSADCGSGVRIRLDAGVHIEVERDFDPVTLRAVIQALAENNPR